MDRYQIRPDCDMEPTLWEYRSEEPALADHIHPRAIARRCDTPPELWTLARLLAGEVRPREALASDWRYALARVVAADAAQEVR